MLNFSHQIAQSFRPALQLFLTHEGRLERAERTHTGGGVWSVAWEEVADVRAAVRPLRADERIVAGRVQAEATHLVTIPAPIRSSEGAIVTPSADMRLVLTAAGTGARGVTPMPEQALEIVSIQVVPESHYRLACREVA